ncbi:uncharacterized protein LOC119575140 [Penaeus monodon]|uniref:uncharacterized protein LOC119575140 n=1 Tax=Penaeus monodon TaxID=6687 RepID=UPI0018A6F549|nr:uncharacterized protein LOC119575140 [Penaeus monodon]
MARFLRRLFCCCFPKVEDDVTSIVEPRGSRGNTNWTHPSNTERSHAQFYSSSITQVTTLYSNTKRTDTSVSRQAISSGTSNSTSTREPNAIVSKQISRDLKHKDSLYKPGVSDSRLDTSDGRGTAEANKRVIRTPVADISIESEWETNVGEYKSSYSYQKESKRETLESKYEGHPTLKLQFGSRALEKVIRDDGVNALLDLHGMTVREATDWFEYFLSFHQDLGTDSMKVVTGRGNNSADGKAKIKPVIEDLLGELGLKFRIMSKGGCYLVWL